MLALPPKKDLQSLHGYVREHLRRLEHELSAGVPYEALAKAVHAAGFEKVPMRSIRTARCIERAGSDLHALPRRVPAAGRSSTSLAPLDTQASVSSAKDEGAAIARHFRELVRISWHR